jgi:putative nucleotidyltransferase with HDIG domain
MTYLTSPKQLVEVGTKLPPVPLVIQQLLDRLHEDDVSVDNLVRIARNDSVVSSAILSAANRLRRMRLQPDTSDMFSAASLIGTNKLKQIVISAGMNHFVAECSGQRYFYEHSLAVAIIAQELAQLTNISTDDAYIAGILHDIGQLAHTIVDAKRYRDVRLKAEQGGDLLALETDAFGLNHCEFGLLLASHWKLPQNIMLAIGTHHDKNNRWQSKLHAAINLAETICRGLDLPHSPQNHVLSVNTSALEHLGLHWDSPEMQDLFARARVRFAHLATGNA